MVPEQTPPPGYPAALGQLIRSGGQGEEVGVETPRPTRLGRVETVVVDRTLQYRRVSRRGSLRDLSPRDLPPRPVEEEKDKGLKGRGWGHVKQGRDLGGPPKEL